jgi:hypothetical protein
MSASAHRDPSTIKALQDELAGVLRQLHKALLDAEAERFGPIGSPFELLNLALNHEHFAWLRSLSELMVELDEARDAGAMDEERLAGFRIAVEELVGPRASSQPQFRERYAERLQLPPVAMAHGDLRRVLEQLPGEPPGERGGGDGSLRH